MHFFHKWSKWEQYEQLMTTVMRGTGQTFESVEFWQRRHCLVCGFVQRKRTDHD